MTLLLSATVWGGKVVYGTETDFHLFFFYIYIDDRASYVRPKGFCMGIISAFARAYGEYASRRQKIVKGRCGVSERDLQR